MLKEVSVLGSRAGNRSDARAALRALERGDIAPIAMESVSLEDINQALARLKNGDVTGRFVVEIGAAG